MTGKYEVTFLLWSKSRNAYIQPGEIIELDDAEARLLMDKNAVKPAVVEAYRRPLPESKPKPRRKSKQVQKQE